MRRLQQFLRDNSLCTVPILLLATLVLMPVSGCMSMMAKQKQSKAMQAQEFSCGEPLPGRPGTVRGSVLRSAE